MLKRISAALILSLLLTIQSSSQSARDTTLSNVRQSDAAGRSADGSVPKLTPAEHMRRANVYLGNRAFAEARAHWQALLDNYPQDPRAAEALLASTMRAGMALIFSS